MNIPETENSLYSLTAQQILKDTLKMRPSSVSLADRLERLGSRQVQFIEELLVRLLNAAKEGSVCVAAGNEDASTCDEIRQLCSNSEENTDLAFLIGPASAALKKEPHNRPLIIAAETGDRLLIYLHKYFSYQKKIFERISPEKVTVSSLQQSSESEKSIQLIRDYPAVIQGKPVELTSGQWQAVQAASDPGQKIILLTGGPGTGKTITAFGMIRALLAGNTDPARLQLTAPTGRAAMRLGESVRSQAAGMFGAYQEFPGRKSLEAVLKYPPSTIHRFLLNPQKNIEAVIVDEVSMVDLKLMVRLFDQLPEQCRIILIGDSGQLPSVNAGSVLADLEALLKNQKSVSMIQLGRTIRSGRIIEQAAAKIRQGVMADFHILKKLERKNFISDEGIFHFPVKPERTGLMSFLKYWTEQYYGNVIRQASLLEETTSQNTGDETIAELLAQTQKARILSPVRSGPSGSRFVNLLALKIYKQMLHEQRRGLRLQPGVDFLLPGVPVIVLRNDYQRKLFNGDTGILWPYSGKLYAFFQNQDGLIRYPAESVDSMEAAFCHTVHKSQGSEYDTVALLLADEMKQMLVREILYTGITRAKRSVLVYGPQSAVIQCIDNPVQRESGSLQIFADHR